MKKLSLLFFACILLSPIYATTYYTVANGSWSGNIWATCSTCTGAALPTLVANDVLVIDDRATIASSTVTIAVKIKIIIRTDESPNTVAEPAKLIFTTGGKLVLSNSGSSVVLENVSDNSDDPMIDGSGSGASNIISIGGTEYWRAGDGDIQGTGTLQSNATLPVKIKSFESQVSGNTVALTWTTTLEEAFSHFDVLHSLDGIHYETIGFVAGAGQDASGISINYSFTDRSPALGYNYYCLQAVDLDGNTERFKVIAVKMEGEKKVSVYPNPSSGGLINFMTNFTPSDTDILVVSDQLGHELFKAKAASINGEIMLPNNVDPGIYYLKYHNERSERVVRLVITR